MKDSTWLGVAKYIAEKESKCISWQVGAVIVKNDRVVSTGINGTPSKQPNCCDVNAHLKNPDGTWISEEAHHEHHQWSKIHEIHAELNAIMYAKPDDRLGSTLYCTLQPCSECSKAIAGSGIKTVIYQEKYHRSSDESLEILTKAGINVIYLPQ